MKEPMPDKTLLTEIIALCDRAIPKLDEGEPASKLLAVFLRQARTEATKQLAAIGKGGAAHG